MNPQFCPPLQLRPRFVPVIVRPTVPVGYTPFTQDHQSSPVHCVEPLFPFGLSPEAVFDSPTTSKTRRDLEQLGRPTEHVAEMIFELAAQKNGIRIGMDHSKGMCITTTQCSDCSNLVVLLLLVYTVYMYLA